MKNFHQNLLIIFALALCLLCAGQWYRETGQRNQIDSLNLLLSQKIAALQGSINSIRILDSQVAQMDGTITRLKATIKTNDQLILTQKRELNRFETENVSLANQVAEFKSVVESLQKNLKAASDGIKKQNEAIQELVAQRDEFVAKLNDSVKERNKIVEKYNQLVARMDKLHGDAKPTAK